MSGLWRFVLIVVALLLRACAFAPVGIGDALMSASEALEEKARPGTKPDAKPSVDRVRKVDP